MRKLIVVSAIVSLLLGLLAAGCGGSEKIDKEAYIEQANQVCKQVSGKLAADVFSINKREAENPNANGEKIQIALIDEGFVPRLEEELQKIRALELPEEEEKAFATFLDVYQRSIEEVKAKAKLAAVNVRMVTPPEEAIALSATRLGITECPISAVNSN